MKLHRVTLRRPVIVSALRFADDTYTTKVNGLLGHAVSRKGSTTSVLAYRGYVNERDGSILTVELGTFKRINCVGDSSIDLGREQLWCLDNRVPVNIELAASVIDSVTEEEEVTP